MPVYTDQLGRTITLFGVPKRIVSLVPSQTELLAYMGLDDEVVGITKFCIHPPDWFRSKTRIGGTKTVNIEGIRSLQPDLIIANKEENVQAQIETLATEFPVWVSDINSLADAYKMIKNIGGIVIKQEKAEALVKNIRTAFSTLNTNDRIKAAYLIWREPYMTIGGDTFINDMMLQAGFENIFTHAKRYPQITAEELQHMDCKCLLLSSEPYPFTEKHIAELQSHLPSAQIFLVDGEAFSWYGSRLIYSASYFANLLKKMATAT